MDEDFLRGRKPVVADDWHCKQLPNGANPLVICERETLQAEIKRLRAELADAYDACRHALADSPRWQALAETVVHTYKEASRG